MGKALSIIKVGGKIVEEEATLSRFLDDFAAVAGPKILVHGGGRSATRVAEALGMESRMVNGRRVTDAGMLKVVTMVYGGLVNKNIVAGLQNRGILSLGLTGADLGLIRSKKRPAAEVDYGFVGDVESVNAPALSSLLEGGVVPVLAPLTFGGPAGLLNTNADTIAGEAAKALAAAWDVSLYYCFEKGGVLRDEADEGSVIPVLSRRDFEAYKAEGVIQGGMIPKLENAFEAVSSGVKRVVITSASAFSKGGGTLVSG